MSDAPERLRQQNQQQASPREESALPVAAAVPAAHNAVAPVPVAPVPVADIKRRTALRVVTGTIVIAVVTSTVLEYAGWQIAFGSLPAPHTSIPPLAFLRGVWDTTLGAVGIGAAAAAATLVLFSTWRNPWRRMPAAFALGAASFLGFLSFVTFGFFR